MLTRHCDHESEATYRSEVQGKYWNRLKNLTMVQKACTEIGLKNYQTGLDRITTSALSPAEAVVELRKLNALLEDWKKDRPGFPGYSQPQQEAWTAPPGPPETLQLPRNRRIA